MDNVGKSYFDPDVMQLSMRIWHRRVTQGSERRVFHIKGPEGRKPAVPGGLGA